MGTEIMVLNSITDIQKVENSANELQKQIANLSKTVNKEYCSIADIFTKIAGMAKNTKLFPHENFRDFAKEVINVRSQFQQLETAFTMLTGSAKTSNDLMQQLLHTAATTPFSTEEITQSAKQLLTYGVAAEDVNDTLIRLGDIASYLSVPIKDLSVLYGTTMAQGCLKTQELEKYASLGIPLVQELSYQLGIAEDDVYELVNQGNIGFQEVRQAIESLTDESGKFGGSMDAQGKTIAAQLNNIDDCIEQIYNELGKQTEGLASNVLSVTYSIVSNWESIGNVIMTVLTAYGSYKAAVLAVAAAHKIASIGTMVQQFLTLRQSVGIAQAAMQAFNITLKANPIGLVLSVVSAAVTAFTLFSNKTDEATESTSEYGKEAENAIKRVNVLTTALSQLNKGGETHKKTLHELNQILKQYGAAQITEADNIDTINEKRQQAIDLIKQEGLARTTADMLSNAEQQRAKKTSDAWEEYYEKFGKVARKGAVGDASARSQYANKDLDIAKLIITDVVNANIDELAGKEGDEYDDAVEKIKKEIQERLKKAYVNSDLGLEDTFTVRGNLYYDSGYANSILDKLLTSLVQANDEMGSVTKYAENLKKRYAMAFETSTTGNEDIADIPSLIDDINAATERYRKALENLDKINANKDAFTADDYKKAVEEVKKAKEELASLGVETDSKDDKSIEEAAEMAKRAAMELAQAEIDAMQEGTAKTIAQIRLDGQKKIDAITEEEEAYKKKLQEAGSSYTDEDAAGFDRRRETVRQETDKAVVNAEQANADEIAAIYEQLADVFITEEERKMAAIEKRYDELRKLLNKKLSAGDIGQDEYDELLSQTDEAEVKEKMRNLVEAYGTAYQKIEVETRKAAATIEEIYKLFGNTAEADEMVANVEKETNNAIFHIEKNSSDVYKKIFTDPLKMTKEQIREAIKLAEEQLKAIDKDASPDAFKELTEALDKLKEAEKITIPFEWDSGLENILKKTMQIKDLQNEIEEARKRGEDTSKLKEDLENMRKSQRNTFMATGVDTFISGLQQASQAIRELAEISGDSRLSNIADQLDAVGNLLSSTAQGAASGGWIGAVVGAATSIIDQTIEAITKAASARAQLESDMNDYADSLRLQSLEVDEDEYDTIFGIKSISKASDAYAKAQKAMQEYNATVNKQMNRPEYEEEFKSIGAAIFLPGLGNWGWGKEATNEYKKELEAYQRGLTELQGMAVNVTQYSGWAKFWGAKDKYQSLIDLAPQLWDDNGEFVVEAAEAFLETNSMISEEQRKQIQNAIDLKEAYDEAMSVVDDQISSVFGNIASDLTDIIADSVNKGTDAWTEFQRVGAETIDSLGKQMLQELMISEFFEGYRDRMREAYQNSDPTQVQNELSGLTSEMFTGLQDMIPMWQDIMEQWYAQAEAQGMDLSSLGGEDNTREAASQGIAQASQDSVDELNARMTTIQSHTYTLVQGMAELNTIGNTALARLAGIEDNTGETNSRLTSVETRIVRMASTIEYINTNGIKVRV